MNLLRTLATVSSMTFLSRVLGYVRDFFIARMFGAGLATDAFFVAFRIPNLLRRMFAEGAGRRRAQSLEPLCGPGVHAGAAQRVLHRCGGVLCGAFRPAGVGARLGGVCSRLTVSSNLPGSAAN